MLRQNIGPDKFYEKVIYKKVNIERSDEMIEKLDQFLMQTQKAKYSVTAEKLLRSKTISADRGE